MNGLPAAGKPALDANSCSQEPLIEAVDLFCGLGGLTHGLVRGGVKVVAGIDVDSQCSFAYTSNNDALFVEANVRDLKASDVDALYGDGRLRLLAGCAPCQPFSTYSRKGREGRLDSKWNLLTDFGRMVAEIQPEFVTMENVPQLLNHEVFKRFRDDLVGYYTWWDVVECARYGVPQARKRLVFLASRLGPLRLVEPDDGACRDATVRHAIAHLPRLGAGDVDPNDALHASSSLSELNLRRIKASKQGGTWRDWEESLIAECHRKASGQTYPSVYGRMEWDSPAPTITTQCFGFGNGRFGHPDQDRAISLREAAILQTFPDDYRFLGPGERVRFSKFGRLIGNAVPVRLGEVIAETLLNHVAEMRPLSSHQ